MGEESSTDLGPIEVRGKWTHGAEGFIALASGEELRLGQLGPLERVDSRARTRWPSFSIVAVTCPPC